MWKVIGNNKQKFMIMFLWWTIYYNSLILKCSFELLRFNTHAFEFCRFFPNDQFYEIIILFWCFQAQLLSQSRIVEFVRESQRVLIGELSQTPSPTTPLLEEDPHLQFYISPQVSNHFMAVVAFATRHATNRGFPIIR